MTGIQAFSVFTRIKTLRKPQTCFDLFPKTNYRVRRSRLWLLKVLSSSFSYTIKGPEAQVIEAPDPGLTYPA
jgi:hypothetical protein